MEELQLEWWSSNWNGGALSPFPVKVYHSASPPAGSRTFGFTGVSFFDLGGGGLNCTRREGALAGWASWLEHCAKHQKVVGLIPSWGACRRQTISLLYLLSL